MPAASRSPKLWSSRLLNHSKYDSSKCFVADSRWAHQLLAVRSGSSARAMVSDETCLCLRNSLQQQRKSKKMYFLVWENMVSSLQLPVASSPTTSVSILINCRELWRIIFCSKENVRPGVLIAMEMGLLNFHPTDPPTDLLTDHPTDLLTDLRQLLQGNFY